MKKLLAAIAVATVIAVATAPQALAGNTYGPDVIEQQNQYQRLQHITQSMKSGTFIIGALVRVLNQQAKIYRLQQRLKADSNNQVKRLVNHSPCYDPASGTLQ